MLGNPIASLAGKLSSMQASAGFVMLWEETNMSEMSFWIWPSLKGESSSAGASTRDIYAAIADKVVSAWSCVSQGKARAGSLPMSTIPETCSVRRCGSWAQVQGHPGPRPTAAARPASSKDYFERTSTRWGRVPKIREQEPCGKGTRHFLHADLTLTLDLSPPRNISAPALAGGLVWVSRRVKFWICSPWNQAD